MLAEEVIMTSSFSNVFRSRVRTIIRSSPVMYKSWLVLRSGNADMFPTKIDHLHVAGYQRSGNTFAMRLLKKVFPENRISTHIHSVSSIKIALRNDVPVVVLIRDPVDAITSSILKRVDSKNTDFSLAARYDIDEYLFFYDFVKSNLDRLLLVDFQLLTRRPDEFVALVQNYAPSLRLDQEVLSEAVLEVEQSLRDDFRSDGDRNFPSSYKQENKKRIYNLIKGDEAFVRCLRLKEDVEECLR